MATIDRSKYKATAVQKVIEQEKALGLNSWGGPRKYHTLDPGKNKFRIYPARDFESEISSYILPKVCHFLPFEHEGDKGQKTLVWKPIFNSRVHGGTKKDIIDEYCKISNEILKKLSAEEFKKRMSIINGYRDSKGGWHSGIIAQPRWTVYADKYTPTGKNLSLLDLTPGCKEQMNKLSITEGNNEPIQTDPFTDVDEGICLIIDYNNKATKASEYYTCSLDEVAVSKFKRELVPTPLTDEDIEEWLKLDSLETLLINSYKRTDFEKAVIGLENFDKEFKIGVFDSDEFQQTIAEMDILYAVVAEEPIPNEPENITESNNNTPLKEVNIPKKEEPQDDQAEASNENAEDIDSMDRNELKLYIFDHKLGINVKPSYTEDQIRFLIKQVEEESTPAIEEKIEEKKVEEKKVEKKKESTPEIKTSTADRIAALRKKQEENKK
jgi:hypothetical protein